jgi:hypothetical protein
VFVAVAFVLVSAARSVATFYTDVLWFTDLGHVNVMWTQLASAGAAALVFGAVTFVIVYVNMVVARRMAPRAFLTLAGGVPEQFQQGLVQLKTALEPVMRWVLIGLSLLVAAGTGVAMAANWQLYQLALHPTLFGIADAQFGKDVSFYVFSLPALRAVSDWLTSTLVIALVLTAAVHVFDGAIRPWERLRGFAPHVKAHLSVIGGLIVASKAFDYWLQTFELDFSPRGQVLGASYTDVNAQLPALYILIVIALISGFILLVNIRFQGWRLPAIALGVWIATAVLVGGVYPALVQQLRVAPNEIALESPYIKRNIMATRHAFQLDSVETRPFAANADLTPADVTADAVTVDNVRLWDPNVMKTTYKQLQEIRPYYDFNDVDIDRYTISGRRTEVLSSVREMNVSQLADQAKTWLNQHLVYTHGYGAVVSPVNDVASDGTPAFVVRDIPPSTASDLKITQPAIYFGEETNTYVVVGSPSLKEFDYPKGAENATTNYRGKTGVPVGGALRRLAFALRYGSTDILLSAYITPESRVLYVRGITDRVSRLAPFLTLDRDPYPAIVGGRIVWILDGYTTSADYPYSQRAANGVNYQRNSVKATVDAYDGTVHLYAFDEKDPVLATWRKVFPGLVEDASAIPAAVRAHFRYPEDFFTLQAEVYQNYHMLDPTVFYNKEDSWNIPKDQDGAEMRPFYVLMRLPEESSEDFVLMLPFTPRSKANMIGWMAARSDPGNYGQRLVFQFPKQKLILGPEQVRARINQEPTISQQLSLWNQRGSRVLFGNLLVLPIKDSIIYVQPLYLQAEQTAIPQLVRVVVAYGNRLSMQPDLASALTQAFGFAQGTQPAAPSGAQATGTIAPPTSVAPASVSAELAQARDLYDRALAAQRAGDWASYGKLIGQLGDVLGKLAAQSPPATGTAKP